MPYDKTKPYACPCCGYWNGDMKYDYYRHKKPLIKDKKIRKAVRAWAEANGCGSSIGVATNGPNIQFEYVVGSVHHPLAGCFLHINAPIRFRRGLKFCNNCTECYTIEELCGEEEDVC